MFRSMKHRPVKNFPSDLEKYAINFCYRPHEYNYSHPFLAEVIMIPELVTQLNSFLRSIPQKEGYPIPLQKNIMCKDIINPHMIPFIVLEFDSKENAWRIPTKVPIDLYSSSNIKTPPEDILNPGKYTLIQNKDFLLAIRNGYSDVELYIYKK